MSVRFLKHNSYSRVLNVTENVFVAHVFRDSNFEDNREILTKQTFCYLQDCRSMSMSKTTRERMATMVQRRQEEAERRMEERQRDKLRQQSSEADLADGKSTFTFMPPSQ